MAPAALSAALLMLAALAEGAQLRSTACNALYDQYKDEGVDRNESVVGRATAAHVVWDGSAPSHAAAALLAAALHHALRLRAVRLARAPSLCRLAATLRPPSFALDDPERLDEVTLVASGVWSPAEDNCAFLAPGEGPPRLRALDAGPAPPRLRLHVALARHANPLLCRNLTRWLFYSNDRNLIACGFHDVENFGKPAIEYYYPVEWKGSALEIARRAAAAGVILHPVAMEANRKQLTQNRNISCLFLDYDMWSDLPLFQPVEAPPGPPLELEISTVRMADVNILRKIAPKLLQLFVKFKPTWQNLREVLELESSQTSIEDAACVWANQHPSNFKKWTEIALDTRSQVYEAAIFLCENDPDWHEYFNLANEIKDIVDNATKPAFNFRLVYFSVDCKDEHSLMRKLVERTQSAQWARLVGALGAGAGTRAAAGAAAALDAPLLLYDAPAAPLPPAARPVCAPVAHLARLVAGFLAHCGWSRILLLSDNSELAASLVDSLRANPSLNVLNVPLDSIYTALQTTVAVEGRIIFLNTDAATAATVLCAAHDRGMTSDDSFVWILREWHGVDIQCANTSVSLVHYTVSLWWRGGGYGGEGVAKGVGQARPGSVASAMERRWRGRAWPLRAAPFADAVTLLLHGFYHFLQKYPHRQDDLHGGNMTRLFWESVKELSIEGVTQTLILDNHGLVNPYAFVDQWNGSKRESIAIWRIVNNEVVPERSKRSIFKGKIPSDGTVACWTTSSGDRFSPRCGDVAALVALATAVASLPLLLAAWRLRDRLLERRAAVLAARLLAASRHVAAALADHLVDRAHLHFRYDLGSGRFGVVRLAVLRRPGHAPVAVAAKTLHKEVSPAEEREFLNEAIVLGSLRHERIVRLVGVCAAGGPPLLLMEHAFYGDLQQYLAKRRHLAAGASADSEARHVSAEALTRLAREAAAALAYLATRHVVHRDVRASNCLVDSRRSLKLADFGMARRAGLGVDGEVEYSCRRRGLFPVLWMAPESLERGVFTAATDAWALGVLLLELATLGARPYGDWPPLRVLRYVSAGGRPPLPPDATPDTRRVLEACWRRAPGERLTAVAVGAELAARPALLRPALLPPALLPPAPPFAKRQFPTTENHEARFKN